MMKMIDQVQIKASSVVTSTPFQRLVVGMIAFSALLLGLETDASFVSTHGELLKKIDRFIIGFFVLEILVKILARGRSPLRHFKDPWNVVDFAIVVGCLIPSGTNAMAVFRLVRVLRIFRLVTALPKLQIIIAALVKSVPSMGYVVVLLSIHFYMFGVLGNFLFSKNDPIHFETLGRSFLTLFQVLTLEGWVDVMRVQIYGCATYGYEAFAQKCTANQPQPIAGILYFISFIVMGTMTILNLLIGVVVNSMAESQKNLDSVSVDQSMQGVDFSSSANQFILINQKLDRLERVLRDKA